MYSIVQRLHTFARPAFFYCLMLLAATTMRETIAHAQTITTTTTVLDGKTPGALQYGSPAGSYPLTGFDNVNIFNGNLNLRLPLLKVDGRGSAQMTVTLARNLKSWHIKHTHKDMPDGNTIDSYVPTQSGWGPYSGYGAGRLDGRNYGIQTSTNMTCRWYSKTLSRLTFSTSDGTEYELRDQLTNGQPLSSTCSQGAYRGTVFITANGSAATFISDVAIYDNPAINAFGPHNFAVSGVLMLKDGTRYRIDNSSVTWIRDRNGNKISFTYSASGMTITDPLNRTITINYDVSDVAPYGLCDQIIFKGFGGAQRILRVSKTALANALRPNSGYTIRTLGGPSGLFPETNGSTSTTHNPTVTSAVWLPDGIRSYKFYYNSYAELARVELPTGGAYEYDMTPGSGVTCWGICGADDDREIYRRLVERRVYSNGGSGSSFDHKEIYTNTEQINVDNSTVTVERIGPTGTVLSRSRHYFDGSALDSLFGGAVTIPYPTWWSGNEKQTDLLATSGDLASATVLRRTVTTRANRTPVPWWPNMYQPSTMEPPNDTRITQIVTTIEPAAANLVSKTSFGYDDSVPFNNENSVQEYGFNTGSPGGLVRETRTTYLTSSTYTDTNVHIRDLVIQKSLFEGATERMRSTTEYDNYGADSYHAALVNRSSLSGFDSGFTTGYTTRGNATAASSHLIVNGSVTGSLTSYTQYDITGNAVKLIDARSTPANVIATTIEYDDRYGIPDQESRTNSVPPELSGYNSFACPTRVTNPAGHVKYAQFDYYLGEPVNSEDANGVVDSGSFNDLLDRPTQVRRAIATGDENQTTFSYDDSTRTVTTSSDRDAVNDNILIKKILYDPLGRPIEQRQYEGGANFIAVQTQYDALGRQYRTSYPFRPWQGQSALWVTQAFDALSRVTSETAPDNSVVTTSYSGNNVMVTDQAGKTRKSVVDALGRLIEVYEDPTGVNYQTTYLYDVQDNLVKVTQGSQQRFFLYDSLKRLIRGRTPEQATNPALNVWDPITGNSDWSIGYQYDNSNNLTFKTDPRGIVTEYRYDVLSRVTTVLYRINGQPDPNTGDVEYLYDNATLGKGRLWLTYKWGSKPHHTAVGYYDAMGRVKQFWNLFGDGQGGWSPGYEAYRDYNRAGAVILQRYPSARTVTYGYDAAGRATSFSGYLGDGSPRTYSTAIDYSPWGTIRWEQFGTNTNVYAKRHYNIRGQLCDVRASNVNDEWGGEFGALVNYYSTAWAHCGSGTDNNGNVLMSQTIVNSYYMEDRYGYDSLNRITAVNEWQNGATNTGSQQYTYDRWGNRTINPASWGAGINNKQFTVDTTTNRLGVPGGQPWTMTYDNAGNLITDTYSGAGARTYDGENRLITAADNTGQTSRYWYNADGERVRRQVGASQEEWNVYGIEGELLAEYRAGGSVLAPQKEYGYRNGKLLVTAESGPPTSGLVGHWKFDENTGTTAADSSGNGNTGTLTLGATWTTGQSGSATSLDGSDDYVQVGAQSGLAMTNTATFSAWIYPTGPGSLATYGGIIVNREGEYEIARFTDGTIQWAFANANPGWNWINTGGTAPLNQWTHVAVTYESGVVKTYINGTLTQTYNGSGSIGDVAGSQNDFRIGGRQSTSHNFQGRIDEVRTYNRVLSSSEVGTLSSGSAGTRINWLVADHLGTPRIIIDQTGALANVKRHDYLPFGEELTAGAGGRTVAMGYGGGDGVRQQFTDKERDVETGLDYFYARYYASVQGRFINVDPLDINLKRQMTSDREAAATAFRNYIAQPQHWNRYAYALNNPLRYVDPDGSFEYPVTILGQTVMVNIDDDLAKDPVQLAKIQAALQAAIDKINSGETKLTKDQIESIHSMNKIQITKDPKKDNWREFRGTGTFGGTFYMNVYYVLNSTPHGLAGAIIHDSRHSEQIKRGLNYSKFTLPMEREASEFAIGVIYRIGGFPDSEIDVYEKDAVTGHLPAKGGNDKSSPEADRKVWNKMQEPQKPRN